MSLNPKVDSPLFATTVAAAGPLQYYQVDPVHPAIGSKHKTQTCFFPEYGSEYSDPLMYQRGPKFLLQPNDLIYDTQGSDNFATIECEAEGNPNPSYKWYLTKEQKENEIDPVVYDR